MLLDPLPARFLTFALVLPVFVTPPAGRAQDPSPAQAPAAAPATGPRANGAPQEEARTRYRGRRIARTMHWRGAEWLLRETRETEEQGVRMLSELGLVEGSTVCDLGCGNGYHTLLMAEMVGAEGCVIGVDIQPEMLAMLAGRAAEAGVENVTGVLGTTSDPKLEPSSCDLILMVDVYHEVDHPESVLYHARAALRPGGRLVLVEFRLEDPDVPIKPLHKMSKAQILNELAANGFRLAREVDTLPRQHVMIFEARPIPAEETQEQARRAQASEVARGLARALGAADAAVLEAFWADEVVLLPGSELTKESWGGTGAQESVRRADLRGRYDELFESAGHERWRELFGQGATVAVTNAAKHPWATPVDSILEIRLAESTEEPFAWVLRHDAQGRWLAVAERTDY